MALRIFHKFSRTKSYPIIIGWIIVTKNVQSETVSGLLILDVLITKNKKVFIQDSLFHVKIISLIASLKRGTYVGESLFLCRDWVGWRRC